MAVRKVKLTYLKREDLTDTVLLSTFQSSENIDFQPGQFANILVEDKVWRSYSIARIEDNKVGFLVDVTPGGPGSKFFSDSEIGLEVEALAPMGGFIVHQSEKPKIFVATGVGIAPFRSMIEESLRRYSSSEVILIWGVRYDKDYYLEKYFGKLLENERLNVIACITQSKGNVVEANKERVTSALPKLDVNFPDYELYVCGNPEMVVDVIQLGMELGIEDLYSEKY